MAPHSSTLAWKIPWTEEPGGLQSMGSLGVRHDLATSLSLFIFMHWRRKWQPTPVFLPGESQGRGAWWAAVYGVIQSRTWLKWLSNSSSSIANQLPSLGQFSPCGSVCISSPSFLLSLPTLSTAMPSASRSRIPWPCSWPSLCLWSTHYQTISPMTVSLGGGGLVTKSCPTLVTPWSPPDSSVWGLLQARKLEWVAISLITLLDHSVC